MDIGGYVISRKGDHICTDRSRVYPGFEGAHLLSETPELKEGFHLEVLVDTNLIEVYANDGEYVISSAVYGITDEVACSREDREVRIYTTEETEK